MGDGLQVRLESKPSFCVRLENSSDGSQTLGVYALDYGTNRSMIRSPLTWAIQSMPIMSGPSVVLAAVYDSKTLSSTSSPFYNSNLYKALVLQKLDGFDLVYSADEGTRVVVFKLK